MLSDALPKKGDSPPTSRDVNSSHDYFQGTVPFFGQSLLADARRRLADQQAELVRALTSGDASPEGFDRRRIEATARSLARKRADAAARLWPELERTLGLAAYHLHFAAYAAANTLSEERATLSDARAFLDWLACRQPLPDELRLRAFVTDLSFKRSPAGLRRRRGLALRTAWLGQSGRLAIGIRVPIMGAIWMSVPCRRK